ncbi:MAG: hypothetical protein WBP45_07130 [Daejeonella sp.]
MSKKFVKCTNQDLKLDFDKKAAEVLNKHKENNDSNLIYTIGNYEKEGNQIFMTYSIFYQDYKDDYTILSSDILLDENLKEYKYIETSVSSSDLAQV